MSLNSRIFLCLLLCVSSSVSASSVDIDAFVSRGLYRQLLLSPDGKHLAATYQLPDRIGLVIVRREGMQAVARATGEKNSAIADFVWIDNERLLVAPAEQFGELDEPRATGELVIQGIDGASPRKIFHRYSRPHERDGERWAPEVPSTADLIDLMRSDPDRILVAVREWTAATPYAEIEQLTIDGGRRRRLTRSPVHSAQIVADLSGEPRLSFGLRASHTSYLFHRRQGDDRWSLINDESDSGRSEFPLGFAADGRTVMLQQNQSQGPDAIIAWDPDTGERTLLKRDERLDPGQVLMDSTGAVVAVAYLGPRRRVEYFDPQRPDARLQSLLERSFPDRDVYVQAAAQSSPLRLVEVRSERDPGTLFLFDVAAKRADFLMRRLPQIEPDQMAPAEMVRFRARDGLELEAVLTRPLARGEGPWPLVLRPHGGPFGVFDRPDFNAEVQLLAAAGYAVLQVNFRGSGNYGHAFQAAGARQWGKAMQEDLSDAIDWAVEQAVARPGKVCLVGASYGAYAALMGLVRAPEDYACAVGAFGVYDLPAMVREDRRHSRSLAAWTADWVGNTDGLAELSPTEHADSIRAPVLLVAGREDPVAPLVHSRRMRAALQRSGREVEHWFVEGAGHGFVREEHRREYFQRLLRFLAAHLPPAGSEESAAMANPDAP
jgi:dipeptidyl aminopeptidase/acylaminoacyl peptidase